MNEEQILIEFIKIIYKCKYVKSEDWLIENYDTVWRWTNKITTLIIEPIINKETKAITTTTTTIIKSWDECHDKAVSELYNSPPPLLSLPFPILIDLSLSKFLKQQTSLKDYIFSLLFNNIFKSEKQLFIFLTSYLNNNNNDINKISFCVNKIREISSRNSFNFLLKDYNDDKFKELSTPSPSLIEMNNNNNNNNIDEDKDDDIEKRAIAQLIVKYFYKILDSKVDKAENEIEQILSKLFSNDKIVFLWILLIISSPSLSSSLSSSSSSPNKDNNNNSIIMKILLETIQKIKLLEKTKFFIKREHTNLITRISKSNFKFFQICYDCIFLLFEYYLFRNPNSEINSDHLNETESILKELLKISTLISFNSNHSDNNNNTIKNYILNSINQIIVTSKIIASSSIENNEVFIMLINLKNLYSIKK